LRSFGGTICGAIKWKRGILNDCFIRSNRRRQDVTDGIINPALG
jgi:hypothetical protein